MPPAQDYYALLGVQRTATAEEIKKAYRRAALKHHPDRGGDAAKFKELGEVYGVLSDPELRRVYDSGGVAALRRHRQFEQGGGGGGDGTAAADLFSNLFGMPRRRAAGSRARPRAVNLHVTLEEMYRGCRKEFRLTRLVQVDPKQVPTQCKSCGGAGVRMRQRWLGRGMVQQVQEACDACDGAGFICELRREQVKLSVEVDKGAEEGHRIRLAGEGGISRPGELPGDVVIILNQRPHPVFVRSGGRLVATVNVPLADALVGAPVSLQHLSGEKLLLRPPAGHVVTPGSVLRVAGRGMPLAGTTDCGDLLVRAEVVFPKRLAPKARAALADALRVGGLAPGPGKPAGAVECDATEFSGDPFAGMRAEQPQHDDPFHGTPFGSFFRSRL